MRKLQFRILAIFIAIFTIFSLSIGLYSINLLQDYASNSQEEELIKQAKTIASLLPMNVEDPTNLEAATNEATALEMQSDERLTIIDLSGVVVFDTATKEETMEKHRDRKSTPLNTSHGE